MSDIEKFGEFDDIQMGVMSDGTPFFTGRGLASFCGVTPPSIFGWGEDVNPNSPRWSKMTALLIHHRFTGNKIFQKLLINNQPTNAYPEQVCMAFLEYYAFEADEINRTEKAKRIFRNLAGKTFRDFVYALTGYNTKQLTFNQYTLSRINNHHNIAPDKTPLPDGYFCLFDKMIEILQKFDIRIGYQLGESWYDYRDKTQRFLEPDISLGMRFSQLFSSDFCAVETKYQKMYNDQINKPRRKKLWTTDLIEYRWKRDKALMEQTLRIKYKDLFQGADPKFPIPENKINRKSYDFNPSPDSGRTPDDVGQPFCYSNDYTSLFYDWLRDVFFKFCWRDYILDRDNDGWMNRYNQFLLFDEQKKSNILKTSEGGMISGFEFREAWEKQLPSGD
jgi:hypothetical protein